MTSPRGSTSRSGQQGPVRDPQGDAALGRDGRLADQQGGEQRVVDLLGDLLRGGPVVADHLADELHRVLVHLQFQQPEQRVHPVGVLVVLGAQGVDQTAGGVEFAAELLQLGAVAQGGDGAAVVGGHAVGDQHALAADGEQIGAGDPAGQHVGRTARRRAPRRGAARRPRRRCPSSRCASSLSSRMRPPRSRATTPSRMPCSIASRSASSAEMSEKARSRVCRWTRREIS